MAPWNSLLLFLSIETEDSSSVYELFDTVRREGTMTLEERKKSSFCSADICLILRGSTFFFFFFKQTSFLATSYFIFE